MKISALPANAGGLPGSDIGGINLGRTASPEKLAAAKAIAAGEQPIQVTQTDPQVERIKNVRKIKMKTNVSPEQYDATPIDGAKPDDTVQTPAAEVTQPLSPQFAALAKQRRALQVKERELIDRERALQSAPATDGGADLVARLKSQPLSVLQEHGVTYDQLTEAILGNQSGINPEIQALKAEIKSLKEGIDKNFVERDTQAEQQVLAEMRKEAVALAKEGDAYEMVRETNSLNDVMSLIHRTYKKSGEVLEVSEAMQLVEDQLIADNLKLANINKLKSKLMPAQAPVQAPQRTMRTLTNRDGVTMPLDRKARARAAFNGTLKG
jgi:hypothetical protein